MRTATPAKPYPDFPLYAHGNGQWAKKISGKRCYFGRWQPPNAPDYRTTWQAALENYHRFLERQARGAAITADPRSIDLRTLINAYLAHKHAQAKAGTFSPRSFGDARGILRGYRETIGAAATVAQLEADPAPIRAFIAGIERRYGLHAFNRVAQCVRSMWTHAARPESGLLDAPFKWATLHAKKPLREFRRQRRLERANGIFRTFEADEIAAMIAQAGPVMRAAVLLGYYAGYGNTDVAKLPRTAIRVYEREETIFVRGSSAVIPAGWALLDFPRPKTEIDRAAIVPPVVVDALRAVEAMRRPAAAAERPLVFRTAGGRAMVYDVVHLDGAALIDHTTSTDNVRLGFTRLVRRLGRCDVHGWTIRKAFVRESGKRCPTCNRPLVMMPRRGFYCLRHTATTFAAGSGASSDTRNLFEGHAGGGVRQAFYLDPTKLHDLFLIANDLMQRLAAKPPVAKAAR
ncbi:MAG TPA: hypothetical protein VF624_01350 [Tepidisphaeraceae bacterium]|jgi:hypothetical protein